MPTPLTARQGDTIFRCATYGGDYTVHEARLLKGTGDVRLVLGGEGGKSTYDRDWAASLGWRNTRAEAIHWAVMSARFSHLQRIREAQQSAERCGAVEAFARAEGVPVPIASEDAEAWARETLGLTGSPLR